MNRFVLRFNGPGEKLASDLERIRSLPNSRIVDHSDRVLLVEVPETEVTELERVLPDWSVSREFFVPVPDTKKKLNR